MNREVERYLKSATRGLWGKKKREVEEELMAHISGRLNAHLIAGVNEETAVQKTLKDLGQPSHVSAGMTRLHTAPTLMGLATAMSLIILTVFTLITGSMAQSLPGTSYWPSEMCLNAIEKGELTTNALQDVLDERLVDNCWSVGNSLWLNFNTLRTVLEKEDVEIDILGTRVELLFPSGEEAIFHLGSDNISVYDDNNQVLSVDPHYFDLWRLVEGIAKNPNIPLSISGWDNPIVTIGNVSFQIGTSEQPFEGTDFYESYLNEVLFDTALTGTTVYIVNPRTERLFKLGKGYDSHWDESLVQQVRVPLNPPPNTEASTGVYGVVVILDLENALVHEKVAHDESISEHNNAFYLTTARASANGSISLELPAQGEVEFVDGFNVFSAPGEAILVDLSADAGSWFNVILPEQIRLE